MNAGRQLLLPTDSIRRQCSGDRAQKDSSRLAVDFGMQMSFSLSSLRIAQESSHLSVHLDRTHILLWPLVVVAKNTDHSPWMYHTKGKIYNAFLYVPGTTLISNLYEQLLLSGPATGGS